MSIDAIDVKVVSNNYVIVSGSPSSELKFLELPLNIQGEECLFSVPIKRKGTSAVAIRPDLKLVASAGWDNSIRLYSMKSRKHLATISHHLKQVSDIAFVASSHGVDTICGQEGKLLMACGSLDGTVSIFDIF